LTSDTEIDKLSNEVFTVPMFDQGSENSDNGSQH